MTFTPYWDAWSSTKSSPRNAVSLYKPAPAHTSSLHFITIPVKAAKCSPCKISKSKINVSGACAQNCKMLQSRLGSSCCKRQGPLQGHQPGRLRMEPVRLGQPIKACDEHAQVWTSRLAGCKMCRQRQTCPWLQDNGLEGIVPMSEGSDQSEAIGGRSLHCEADRLWPSQICVCIICESCSTLHHVPPAHVLKV